MNSEFQKTGKYKDKPAYGLAYSYAQSIAQILYEVLDHKRPIDRTLKKFFTESTKCGSRDRHFISESLYSLMRWYGWLRFKLPKSMPKDAFDSKPFALSLAAALCLDQHPLTDISEIFLDRSYVDTSVLQNNFALLEDKKEMLKKNFKFKNIEINQLVPEWFAAELPNDINMPSLLASLQLRPPVWLRLQTENHDAVLHDLVTHNLSPVKHDKITNAVKIPNAKFNIRDIYSYKEGAFEVQDLASQCLGLVCNAQPGETWWDISAGGGGKSLLLADAMKGEGKLIATDKREWILKEIERRAQRGGFKNITIKLLEEVFAEKIQFDGVLVDAPCSSIGTWRRNPDMRWNFKSDICATYTTVQLEILRIAQNQVKSGGTLVYATCSLSKTENERVVETFLREFPEYTLENFKHPLTGVDTKGLMRINFLPDDCDAMFATRLRKQLI
jgi:16S rRNA (cytosine967-C5)-methyltransferase